METYNTHGTEAQAPKAAPGLAWFKMAGGGEQLQKVNIYRVDEGDWVAARTLEEAVRWYAKNAPGDVDESFECYEVSDEQLDILKHHGDDYDRGDKPLTFRQELQENIDDSIEFPCIFASREV